MPTIYKADEPQQNKPDKSDRSTSKTAKASGNPKEEKRTRLQQIANGVKSKTGLSVTPQRVEFVDQKDGEDVLLILRRHYITNMSWVAIFVFMITALLIASGRNWLEVLPSSLRLPFIYLWLVFALTVAWAGFIDWYFNVNVVSNERIVDIDFYNLIYREVTDAEIEKVQDVTHNMGGLFGLLFNYGDIFVQTAAANPEIEFINVPDPAKVAGVLREIREEVQEENGT